MRRIFEGEGAEIFLAHQVFGHQAVGVFQHFRHVRHVEVADVGTEQGVYLGFQGIYAVVEGPDVHAIVGFAAEIEVAEQHAEVFYAVDLAGREIVQVGLVAGGGGGFRFHGGVEGGVAADEQALHVLGAVFLG